MLRRNGKTACISAPKPKEEREKRQCEKYLDRTGTRREGGGRLREMEAAVYLERKCENE